jgi:endonuclease YncB( thermonuclease family)
MSRHWKPPSGKIVRIRPGKGKWLRSLDEFVKPDFAGRFGRRQNWTRIQSYWRAHRSMPEGAKAGLVLIGAAFVGIGIGAWQVLGPRDIIADEVAVQPSERVKESIVPQFSDTDADAEWAARGDSSVIASRGEAIQPGLPRGPTARNDGVRASFSYCKWGGGTNCVVDGDTFYIGGAKVRIADIDAPETHDYRCRSELELGERAARELQTLLNSGAVTMTSIDRNRDVYGRLLRNVQVNGRDVGAVLISDGVARAYAGGRRPWC